MGSNLGERTETLRWAAHSLDAWLGPLRFASLYASKALTPGPCERAPDYLNTVAVGRLGGEHDPTPEDLLAMVKALELAAGRERATRWAPRPLDIDMLFVGRAQRALPVLTLPHPGLASRRFVLEPLAELVPDFSVPPHGTPIRRLLEALDAPDRDRSEAVERVRGRGWHRIPTHGAPG